MSESLKKELETLCLEILKTPSTDYDQMIDWCYALQEKMIVVRHLSSEAHASPDSFVKGEEIQRAEDLFVIEEEDLEVAKTQESGVDEDSKEEITQATIQEKLDFESKESDKEEEKTFQNLEEIISKEPEPVQEKPTKTEFAPDFLNKKFATGEMKVGLNDRIAFVKHLFRESTEDFNRVLSQINSFENFDETLVFIEHIVAPEYGWKEKQEYVTRFKVLVATRFGVELNEEEG